MNRSVSHGLVFELLFSAALVTIAALVVWPTHWSRFWVVAAVFTVGYPLRYWVESRRQSSTRPSVEVPPDSEQKQTTRPPA